MAQQGPVGVKALTIRGNAPGALREIDCQVEIGPAPLNLEDPPIGLHAYRAIWDTGASATVITQRVVDECGLLPSGRTQVNTANGLVEAWTYLIFVGLPNQVGYVDIRASCLEMHTQDVLIGMDIITTGDVSITTLNGNTVFSFRHPSMHELDFVAHHQQLQSMNREQRRGNKAKKKHR